MNYWQELWCLSVGTNFDNYNLRPMVEREVSNYSHKYDPKIIFDSFCQNHGGLSRVILKSCELC